MTDEELKELKKQIHALTFELCVIFVGVVCDIIALVMLVMWRLDLCAAFLIGSWLLAKWCDSRIRQRIAEGLE